MRSTRRALAWGLPCGLFSLLSGCATTPSLRPLDRHGPQDAHAESGPLAQQVRELREQVQRQERLIARLQDEVNDGFSLALCRPELQKLLSEVQRECQVPTGAAEPMLCTTRQIRPALIAADPEHRGRFLRMMSSLRHEVVYVPRGRSVIPPGRAERLGRLARQSLLRATVFIVVSHAEGGERGAGAGPPPAAQIDEAVRRAEYVEDLLVRDGVPRERLRRWIYAYPASRADIERPTDRPGPGEPEDLTRGVWVFRADC